jgi:predicted nucleotidyltransferase
MNKLINRIVAEIASVDGVAAVVLGGSRARGTATPASDIDLGIYYDPARPPDLARLSAIAQALDDARRPDLLTPLGGWGPNINGGGWLTVAGTPVDFLYRDLDRVAAAIDDCRAGKLWFDYQPGHPHGFGPQIYLAEIALCQPLHDPQGRIAALKSAAIPYPAALATALIGRFWWEAEFALQNARKSVGRADLAYAAGCCFRSVACLLQTLFALNAAYWMNEKGALALAAGFARIPANLQPRVELALSTLAADADAISAAIALLAEVVDEVKALV